MRPYTRLLAPVLTERGELYIAYGTTRVAAKFKDVPGFEKLKVTAEAAKLGIAPKEFLYCGCDRLGRTTYPSREEFRRGRTQRLQRRR